MRALAMLVPRTVLLGIGVIWAFAAMSKAIAPADDASWFMTFPEWERWLTIGAEAAAATLFFAGPVRAGLWLGLFLLIVFSVVLVLDPAAVSQSCGCLGAAASGSGAGGVAAHLFALGSLHLLGTVMVGERGKGTASLRIRLIEENPVSWENLDE